MSKAKLEALETETTEIEEVIERPYTLRKLSDGDLMPLLQLLRKVGLKDFKEAFIQETEGKEDVTVGKMVVFDIADVLIGKIGGNMGEEIYKFWSELSGIPAEEIKQMEFGTLPLMVYDTFNEVRNTSFFKVLSRLL